MHSTSFNNKLSRDNMIEKCSSEHVKMKKKENKDEEEKKTRTLILNCRNVKGGWNLSIYPLMNPYALWRRVSWSFRNQETNSLLLLQTDIYRPCRENSTKSYGLY